MAKGLITELASLHAHSAWGSKEKRVRVVRLTARCNYFSKKKNYYKMKIIGFRIYITMPFVKGCPFALFK